MTHQHRRATNMEKKKGGDEGWGKHAMEAFIAEWMHIMLGTMF